MMLDEPLVTGARFGARSLQPCHTCTTARLMSAIEGARPNQQRQKPSRAYLLRFPEDKSDDSRTVVGILNKYKLIKDPPANT